MKTIDLVKAGDTVRTISGAKSKVIEIGQDRVRLRDNESGERRWVDILELNATFKTDQDRADVARLIAAIAREKAGRS